MKQSEWNEGLNNLDSDIIENYVAQKEAYIKKIKKPTMWTRYISVAATFCLVFGALAVSLILNRSDDEPITIPETEAQSTTEADTENAPNTEEEPTQTEAPSETVGGVVTDVTGEDVSESEEPTDIETSNEEDSKTDEEYTYNPDRENSPLEYLMPFGYDSFADLLNAVSKENEEKLYDFSIYYPTPESVIALFKSFVAKLQVDGITIPYINGNEIELRNKKGFSNIALFMCELYNLPWIWYFPKVSTGENLYIQITYIPDNILEKFEIPIASDIIKEIAPNAPNVDKFSDSYNAVYNKELQLGDRTVVALVYECVSDKRDYTYFVYDDFLVMVRNNPEVWTDEWFRTLTFDFFNE